MIRIECSCENTEMFKIEEENYFNGEIIETYLVCLDCGNKILMDKKVDTELMQQNMNHIRFI